MSRKTGTKRLWPGWLPLKQNQTPPSTILPLHLQPQWCSTHNWTPWRSCPLSSTPQPRFCSLPLPNCSLCQLSKVLILALLLPDFSRALHCQSLILLHTFCAVHSPGFFSGVSALSPVLAFHKAQTYLRASTLSKSSPLEVSSISRFSWHLVIT